MSSWPSNPEERTAHDVFFADCDPDLDFLFSERSQAEAELPAQRRARSAAAIAKPRQRLISRLRWLGA